MTAVAADGALLSPLWAAEPDRASGLLLLIGVAAEFVQSFRRKTAAAQRADWASAGFTLLLALVLLNTAWLAVSALTLFVAAPFALDMFRHVAAAARKRRSEAPLGSGARAATKPRCGIALSRRVRLLVSADLPGILPPRANSSEPGGSCVGVRGTSRRQRRARVVLCLALARKRDRHRDRLPRTSNRRVLAEA